MPRVLGEYIYRGVFGPMTVFEGLAPVEQLTFERRQIVGKLLARRREKSVMCEIVEPFIGFFIDGRLDQRTVERCPDDVVDFRYGFHMAGSGEKCRKILVCETA